MKYFGKLGIAEQVETSPGVWDETITEHDVVGDLMQRTETMDTGDSILPRYVTTTTVSVLARHVGHVDNSNLRYLTNIGGKRWVIASAVNQPPRMVMYVGEEWHGPVPE